MLLSMNDCFDLTWLNVQLSTNSKDWKNLFKESPAHEIASNEHIRSSNNISLS